MTVRMLKPCGTNAAYRRHRDRGEEPCNACRAAAAAYELARRRASGTVPRRVPDCGTHSGYCHHIYVREEPCGPCRKAHTVAVCASRRLVKRRRRRGTWKDVIVDYLETHGAQSLPELVWLIQSRHTDANVSSLQRTIMRLATDRVVESYRAWDGVTMYDVAS